MAELSKYPVREARFFRVFPTAYNIHHNTHFSGEPERPTIEQGWDYRWPNHDDPSQSLDVQHTAGASDAASERVHPKNLMTIGRAIERHMRQVPHRGYHISVHGDDSPRNPRFQQKLVAQICQDIDTAITRGIPLGESVSLGWNWSRERHMSRTDVILEHVASLKGVLVTGVLGDSCGNTTWRFTEAVHQKSQHYGPAQTDVVLVVDFDLDDYDPKDLDDLRESLRDRAIPFREVWAVDLGDSPKADRVWARGG